MGQRKGSSGSSARGEAIIVLGGSFAPLHAGHLAALEAGKKKAEQQGLVVVAGYLAVAHDSHLRGKLRSRGDHDSSFVLSADARLQMCNEAAAASKWLRPTPCPFGSAKQCGQAMVEVNHRCNTAVLIVRGSDLPALLSSSRGQTVSSTYVRDTVRTGGVAAVRRLALDGVLPPTVAKSLELQLSGAAPAAAEQQPTGSESATADQGDDQTHEPDDDAAAELTEANHDGGDTADASTQTNNVTDEAAAERRDAERRDNASIIFLDGNGVMRKFRGGKMDWDTACIAALKRILGASVSGTEIVLTSSWRRDPSRLARVHEILRLNGLPSLLGTTPVLGKEHAVRGDEILSWLEDNHAQARTWIAIDDGPLHVKSKHHESISYLRLHTVQTASRDGLTDEKAELACKLLGGSASLARPNRPAVRGGEPEAACVPQPRSRGDNAHSRSIRSGRRSSQRYEDVQVD